MYIESQARDSLFISVMHFPLIDEEMQESPNKTELLNLFLILNQFLTYKIGSDWRRPMQ